ncbi:MAG TPA: peroxiredoxin-like family protein [Acidiferrobacterales bacterium]|nr:peroxiredoxin-like family protein [Acidiferrobacterales bacterium]
MNSTNRLKPRLPVPSLEVKTLAGDPWRLTDRTAAHFIMIVFYRGLHCPICKPYLRDLEAKLNEFTARGVDVIAVSTDDRERAQKSQQEWGLKHLTVGYGLTIEKAREWGLYISKAIKESEPHAFSEPGLFLIRPDKTLYAAQISTMPFARPSFNDLLAALDFIIKNNYPARGEA